MLRNVKPSCGPSLASMTTAATKARFFAGSWSADSGDEMLRNVNPSRGPSLASMEVTTTPWVLFSALREEKI